MVSKLWSMFVLVAAVAWMAACSSVNAGNGAGSPPATSHGNPVGDYVSLVDKLRGSGAKVEPAGKLSQPFFKVEAQLIKVNSHDVQVFEYANPAEAEAEATLVSASGSAIGTSMVDWIAAPHFYKRGRLIVLYVGTDAQIINLLESALGAQFAGRKS